MNDPSDKTGDTDRGPVLRVNCYAGHRADTEPRHLQFGGRAVAVTEIIDRWLDPSHRYFKLRGDDGGIYLLRHDTINDSWEISLYDSGCRGHTRLEP
ncbi:MAG: hypothetical protein QNK18_15755 [Gammaproteobacteria bacterium]|nr:hypothetical protein [Gammaproteobacteria bacterium]